MKKAAGTVFLRGPMGEFVSDRADKQHLTALASAMPGPADYVPKGKIKGSGTPEWSIVGKPKDLPVPVGPPPTRYRTEGDLVWDNKTISLKQKGQLCPLGARPDVHITATRGPNAHNVKYGNTGHLSRKFTIGTKSTNDAAFAPVGKDAPGPTYMAPDDRAHTFTLGMSIPIPRETDGPGPAGYDPPLSVRGPANSLGAKVDNELCSSTDITLPRFFGWNVGYTPFRKTNVEDSPGPQYHIGTTVGTGVKKSVAWRQNFHISKEGKVPAWPASNRRAPAPGSYNVRFSDKPSIPKQSMGHSDIPLDDPMEPGPGEYITDKEEAPKKAYTFGTKGKPTYPNILNYVEHSMAADIPAAHQFCGPSNFSKNSGPKAVIAQRLKKPKCQVPAPNQYNPRKDGGHIPQFSIASKIRSTDDNGRPGPGSYNIAAKPETPMFKMTGRPKERKVIATPGPNAYNIKQGKVQVNKGATLKGRPSPYVYSGFKNTNKVSTLCS